MDSTEGSNRWIPLRDLTNGWTVAGNLIPMLKHWTLDKMPNFTAKMMMKTKKNQARYILAALKKEEKQKLQEKWQKDEVDIEVSLLGIGCGQVLYKCTTAFAR